MNCLFLLLSHPLVQNRAVLVHGLTDDGNGALALASDADQTDVHAVKAWLTDNARHLHPTDDPEGQQREEAMVLTQVVDMLAHASKNATSRIVKTGALTATSSCT